MPYEITIRATFSAAHRLISLGGMPENHHGHNWTVEVRIAADELDNEGIALDFTEVNQYLRTVLEELDHKNINELPSFANINPTTENIARYIYEKLDEKISQTRAALKSITLWETPESAVTYKKSGN